MGSQYPHHLFQFFNWRYTKNSGRISTKTWFQLAELNFNCNWKEKICITTSLAECESYSARVLTRLHFKQNFSAHGIFVFATESCPAKLQNGISWINSLKHRYRQQWASIVGLKYFLSAKRYAKTCWHSISCEPSIPPIELSKAMWTNNKYQTSKKSGFYSHAYSAFQDTVREWVQSPEACITP